MDQSDVTSAPPPDAFDLQPLPAAPATARVEATKTGDRGDMLAVLSAKTVKHLEHQLRPGEQVVAVIKGAAKQAIVALDTRLFIVKPGLMAGSTFGARVTSFDYRQITAIELNKKLASAVIEVIAAGYQGTQATSYWSSKEGKDPFKISNCLPLARSDATKAEPVLALIRERIARVHAKSPLQQPSQAVLPNSSKSLASFGRKASSRKMNSQQLRRAYSPTPEPANT